MPQLLDYYSGTGDYDGLGGGGGENEAGEVFVGRFH